MKVTIAINNYNYSKFIIECVNSVLAQTYRDIEIIVVDDGSTDDSLKILNENYDRDDRVKIISKMNGGQLSAFNETIKYVTGDIICFLDADDMYKLNYIEEIVNVYQTYDDVDCIFAEIEKFFPDGKKEISSPSYSKNTNLGFNILSVLYSYEVGPSPTSGMSMKMDLFKKIIPIPFEEDWRVNADVCLDWGASMHGSKRFFYAEPLVSYRVHGNNLYYGKGFSNDYLYKRKVKDNRLLNFFKTKVLIDDQLSDSIVYEYKTRDVHRTKLLKTYIKIAMKLNLPFWEKSKILVKLLKEFRRKRMTLKSS